MATLRRSSVQSKADEPPSPVVIACAACAKLKIKCDKQVPCTRCASRGVPCQPRYTRRALGAGISKNPNPKSARRVSQYTSALPTSNQTAAGSGTECFPNFDQITSSFIPQGSAEHVNSPPKGPEQHGSEAHFTDPMHIVGFPSGNTNTVSSAETGRVPAFASQSQVSPHPLGLDPLAYFGAIDQSGNSMSDNLMLISGDEYFPLGFGNDAMDLTQSLDDFQLTSSASSGTPMASVDLPLPSSSVPSSNHVANNNMVNHVPASFASDDPSTNDQVQELEVVLTSRQHWPAFRCHQVDNTVECPKTAFIYLEGLLQVFSDQDTIAATWGSVFDDDNASSNSTIVVDTISNSTRDKLLVFTQTLLHTALQIHRKRPGRRGQGPSSAAYDLDRGGNEFIFLPTARALEHSIQGYLRRFEPNYPSIPASKLGINEWIRTSDPGPPMVILLLVVALGKMTSDKPRTQYVVNGLAVLCRTGLLDMVERSFEAPADRCCVRSALLFTLLTAWNGDKWQMENAIAQRGMYISMLRQSRLLLPQESTLLFTENDNGKESAWALWKERETLIRLWCSWIFVDLELSLFYDIAPSFSINELANVMPQDDLVWQAQTAAEWSHRYEQANAQRSPSSVPELLRSFVENCNVDRFIPLTALQLRLFLYPIQTLVHSIGQIRTCSPQDSSRRKNACPAGRSRIDARIGEALALLAQWYKLARNSSGGNNSTPAKDDIPTTINLILYHLISLDAFTCFSCIEQMKQADVSHSSWGRRTHLLEGAEEAWFHCGQVLRLLRSIPNDTRPPWWAAAVYRAALISHANSSLFSGSGLRASTSTSQSIFAAGSIQSTVIQDEASSGEVFAIDSLAPEDGRLERYIRFGEGTPVLSKISGQTVPVTDPQGVLASWIELLDVSDRNPFACGVRDRLVSFGKMNV